MTCRIFHRPSNFPSNMYAIPHDAVSFTLSAKPRHPAVAEQASAG